MASRNGSQALADGIRLGFSTSKPVDSTPNPVVTTLALAGFAFAFSLGERFSGLGLIGWVAFAASDPVVTSFSLAAFAGGPRPQAPRGPPPIPAHLTYAPPTPPRPPGPSSCAPAGLPDR